MHALHERPQVPPPLIWGKVLERIKNTLFKNRNIYQELRMLLLFLIFSSNILYSRFVKQADLTF